MKISYAITVCNEHQELLHLIKFLSPIIDKEDEIVVVYDKNRVTEQVLKILEDHKELVNYYPFDFKQNFLENKNYLNSECKGDFIFQIDADEIPSEFLIKNLKRILIFNPDIDLFIGPRVNLVEGLTEEHIQKWKWNVNEKGWVNWPDQQKRIYKNTPNIKWSGHKVHGMVQGYSTFAVLPLEERFCIYHNKHIERQEKQNKRYYKIETGEIK